MTEIALFLRKIKCYSFLLDFIDGVCYSDSAVNKLFVNLISESSQHLSKIVPSLFLLSVGYSIV